MREYGQIQCSFWSDPDIRNLSNEGKLLFAYLLTGPHSNGLGCYRIPNGYVQADLEWTDKTVSERFIELCSKGFIELCPNTCFMLIRNFLLWNSVANGNVAAARVKEFNVVPHRSSIFPSLVNELLKNNKHFPYEFINHIETVSKGLPERYAKQDPTLPYPEPNQTKPLSSDNPDGQKTPTLKFTDEDLSLANIMWTKIDELSLGAKEPNLDQWANMVRLIRERDDRSYKEIIDLFTWANNDNFWQSNILSPKTLRKKWATLTGKMKSEGKNNGTQANNGSSSASTYHDRLKAFAASGGSSVSTVFEDASEIRPQVDKPAC